MPLVIAASESRKNAMVVHGIAADRIKADPARFLSSNRLRLMPQQAARESLAISGDATVLLYVGGVFTSIPTSSR